METVASVLSYGALEESDNPHIESIVELCVSENQKQILAIWVWLGRKSRKRVEAMKKGIHELKAEFAYWFVGERKKQL